MKRAVGILAGSLLAALALCTGDCALAAEDRGVLTLWCKGTAVDNDDPAGRDDRVKTAERQGKATLDFDARQIDFLNWSRVKITEVTYSRILADRNAFESGSGYHVRIDRMSGDVSFQTLVHDTKSGETWYSHSFSGKCAKTDKQGKPVKSKQETTGF